MGGNTRVALIVDRLHDYQMPVIRGAQAVLHAEGCALLVFFSHPLHADRDTTIRRLVLAGYVHGVIVTAMRDVVTYRHRG